MSSSEDEAGDIRLPNVMRNVTDNNVTFADIGVCLELCNAAKAMGWERPTEVQKESIPWALKGRDLIVLAKTGSGKTGAFAIPVIQDLLESPDSHLAGVFCLVLAPTRELCQQIAKEMRRLGDGIGLEVATLTGGTKDQSEQAAQLAKRPNVVVGTLGRVVDHLEHTKGFSLLKLKYLILDEADRMLSEDFEDTLQKVLNVCPRSKRTLLFSATMTDKVSKLELVSLVDPVKIAVSGKTEKVDTLKEYMKLIPYDDKWAYFFRLLQKWQEYLVIVFVNKCVDAQLLGVTARLLGFKTAVLHGQMNQGKRTATLASFKTGQKNILIATEVASRGLDIPHVMLVINFDVPLGSKDYTHRVGRTARAGSSGTAITLVTQYDVETYLRVECSLKRKLEKFEDKEIDEEYSSLGSKLESAKKEATDIVRNESTKTACRKRRRL